jgi:hypothetical protein
MGILTYLTKDPTDDEDEYDIADALNFHLNSDIKNMKLFMLM